MKFECPHCRSILPIKAPREGTELMCPQCGEPFKLPDTIEAPPPPPVATPVRRTPSRRRTDSDLRALDREATNAMIFGIIGLFFCTVIFGPLAMMKGKSVNNRLRLMGRPPNGQATAGYVLGLVEIILMALGVLVVILALIIAGAAGSRSAELDNAVGSAQLLGRWEHQDFDLVYDFQPEGTLISRGVNEQGFSFSHRGTWEIRGSEVYLRIRNPAGGRIDRWYTFRVRGDSLGLISEGVAEVFHRER